MACFKEVWRKLVLGTEDRGRKVERVVMERETVRGTERANVRRDSILNNIEDVVKVFRGGTRKLEVGGKLRERRADDVKIYSAKTVEASGRLHHSTEYILQLTSSTPSQGYLNI